MANSEVLPMPYFQNNKNYFCITYRNNMTVESEGIWNNDSPLKHAFPVILLQIIAANMLSRTLHFFLRPLHQPRIVCDILAGALLGPSVPRFWKGFRSDYFFAWKLFPDGERQSRQILGVYGLMFYLFIIGVKTNVRIMMRSRRRALIVCTGSIAVPLFVTGFSANAVYRKMYSGLPGGAFLMFLPGSLSVTAFPVLADILGEIHLLNSELGRLGMLVALGNDLIGWFFMGFYTTTSQKEGRRFGGGGRGGIANVLKVIAAFTSMLVFVVFVFRPWVVGVARRTPKGALVREGQVFVILVTVILLGLIGDLCGFSFMAGPLALGLAVPDGPPLGATLVRRTEAVVTEVLLPLTFLASGQTFNLRAILLSQSIDDWARWTAVLLVILLSYAATLVGTMAAALYCKIPITESFLLGLIMNFRGLIEIITYMHVWSDQILDVPCYTLLVLCTVLVTGICVPAVEILYKPLSSSQASGWRTVQRLKPQEELRLLACVHNEDPIPIITNLLEVSGGEGRTMCAYVLHLVELVGAVNSSLMAHKNKKGFINPTHMDPLLNAFITFEQQKGGQVTVFPFTTIAPYETMHQDVFTLAVEKDAAMIVVPFPRPDVDGGGMAESDQAVRGVVSNVLSSAPCSVGVLVYQSVSCPVMLSSGQFQFRVGALFWGGADDREAIFYASRMARHAGVSLTVTRFVPAVDRRGEEERRLDDGTVEEFMVQHSGNKRVVVEELVVKEVEQAFTAIHSMDREYDLLLVGRRQGSSSMIDDGLAEWCEWKELGVIGDMLASPNFDCPFPVLVVQQHY